MQVSKHLRNFRIFICDELDSIYTECFEDWDGYKDIPENKEEEQIRYWMKKLLQIS